MSEDSTQNLTDGRSFEERVFLRFDSLDSRLEKIERRLENVELHLERVESRLESVELRLDKVEARLEVVESRLDNLDSRVQKLEIESERRALETKPIWERALAQIAELQRGLNDFREEVNEAFRDISRKFGVLGSDMMQLRADQAHLESRLTLLESKS